MNIFYEFLARRGRIAHLNLNRPIRLFSHWIDWKRVEVTALYKIVELLRRLTVVPFIVTDCLTRVFQSGLKSIFFSPHFCCLVIGGYKLATSEREHDSS